METIGFVGAGMMGSGICANLMKAGHPLVVVAHRNRARIEELVKQGAREAGSVDELAAASDVLMICVNSAEVVESIVTGPGAKLREGALVIDVTTSLAETSKRLAAALAKRRIDFVDAPVVGGPPHAARGKLGTLAGGSAAAFARAEPIIRRYSADLVHFGEVGSGNTAKLLQNFLTVGLRAIIIQSFYAAERHGIDWAKLYQMASQGAAASRTLEQLAGGAAQGNFRLNQFSVANCVKDMTYAGTLLAEDPDGKRMQEAFAGFFRQFADAGFGDRLSSELLSPELKGLARR